MLSSQMGISRIDFFESVFFTLEDYCRGHKALAAARVNISSCFLTSDYVRRMAKEYRIVNTGMHSNTKTFIPSLCC